MYTEALISLISSSHYTLPHYRDSIDATHYPVFHQMEGVRYVTLLADLFTLTLKFDLFRQC